jgi:ComF family protein
MQHLWDRLLQLLFPDRCAVCGKEGELLCRTCRVALEVYSESTAITGLDQALVGFVYNPALRKALHCFKYYRRRRLAQPLGDLLVEVLARHALPVDALLAVPLHAERMNERGFNQSEELARRIAQRTGLALETGLVRTRNTGHQAGLGRRDRLTNVADAFVWCGREQPPARILLIDDVLTTGATLVACADALRRAGGHEVRALTLARSRVGKPYATIEDNSGSAITRVHTIVPTAWRNNDVRGEGTDSRSPGALGAIDALPGARTQP